MYNCIGNSWVEGVCADRKETYVDYVKRSLPNTNKEVRIAPATNFLSHSWGMSFYDTVDTLLPSADDCYVAMITPPLLALWPLYVLTIALVPFVGWAALPVLGHRERVLCHMAEARWWTPRHVTALANASYWIDIFCKNQYVVNTTTYSEDTAEELSRCVRVCGTTALACTPWDSPACLRRVWCQFEIHHTHLAGTRLKAMYSELEKKRMDADMYSWRALFAWLCPVCPDAWSQAGSEMLARQLSQLKVEHAEATVASDREMILSQIAVDFGGEGAGNCDNPLSSKTNALALSKCDERIRQAIIDSIEEVLGGTVRITNRSGKRRPRQIPLMLRVAYTTRQDCRRSLHSCCACSSSRCYPQCHWFMPVQLSSSS